MMMERREEEGRKERGERREEEGRKEGGERREEGEESGRGWGGDSLSIKINWQLLADHLTILL